MEARSKFRLYNYVNSTEATSITEYSGEKVNIVEHGTTRLWCNATGIPEPTVTWYALEITSKQEEVLKGIYSMRQTF